MTALLLNTAYFVVLTNILTVPQVGLVSLLNVVVISVATLSTLALPLIGSGTTATPPAVARFLSGYTVKGPQRSVYLVSVALCAAISLSLAYAMLHLLSGTAAASGSASALLAASADSVAFSFAQLGAYSLVGLSRATLSGKLLVVAALLRYAFASALLLSGQGVAGVFAGFALGDASLAVASNTFTVRSVLGKSSNMSPLRPVFSYMASVFASALVGLGVSQADRLVAFFQQGLGNLGVYNVAVVGASVAAFAPVSITNVLVPSLASEDGSEPRRRVLLNYTRYASLVASPMGMGLAAVSPFLLRLFGDAYAAGAPVLATIAVSVALTSVSSVYSSYLLAGSRAHMYLAGNILGLAALLTVSAVTAGSIGLEGVAAGRAAMLFVSLAAFAYFTRRDGFFVLDYKAYSRSLISSAIMALIVFSLLYSAQAVLLHTRLAVVAASILAIPAGLVLYLYTMKILHGFSHSDFEFLERLLPAGLGWVARLASRLA